MISPFFKGAGYGFLIAATVGPISLLCLRRALTEGFRSGFVSGLGAAAADAVYGAVAALGVVSITQFLLQVKIPLQLAGGLFLVYLGVQAVRTKPVWQSAPQNRGGHASYFASTFFLTLANPMTILSFMAVFAALAGGTSQGSWSIAFVVVLGVFLGSTAWWLILAGAAVRFGGHLGETSLRRINTLAGLGIVAFGIWQLGMALREVA